MLKPAWVREANPGVVDVVNDAESAPGGTSEKDKDFSRTFPPDPW